MPRRVGVIGGGLTGLAAAWELAKANVQVDLFERGDNLGGKIAETSLDGRTIPTGPDAFLARRPEVTALAEDLGLANELITPAAGSARIYRDGILHPLPPNVLGVPATPEVATTGLVSPEGAARAALDLDSADDRPDGDESVGDLVRRRLGDEVHEYLVDPLLGGINAGDSDRLSLVAGVPQLEVLRRRHHSLITAARDTLAAAPTNPAPVFRSIDGGLNRLIDRAQNELEKRENVRLHLGSPAALHPQNDAWVVSNIEVDEVIVTTPAYTTASLIEGFAPEAASLLSTIDYSSVGLTVLVLPPNTIEIDPSISGVLVPRVCGLHVTAVSFASHKWPDLAPDGSQILRVSVGRRTDTRWAQLRDDEVVQLVRNDLSTIFESIIPDGPAKLTRWDDSLPQYDVDHVLRVGQIDESLAGHRGLTLTGAWRNGLGLPACAAAGRAAAVQAR